MTSKQICKLNMYRSVVKLCREHKAAGSAIPVMEELIRELEELIIEIDERAIKEKQDIKGFAADKLSLRKELISTALAIAEPVYAYATMLGDVSMQSSVKYNFSALSRIKENSLGKLCESFAGIAEQQLDSLINYGIKKENIHLLRDQIKKYEETIPMTRTAIQERSRVIHEIKILIEQSDDLLKTKLDKLITALKLHQPEFVSLYRSTRRLSEAAEENRHWEKLERPKIRWRRNANR